MHTHEEHTFGPVYDENARILILGSFPSVKSREQGFYYGHPQNRFWKVLAAIYKVEIPDTVEEKKEFLRRHRIALWDVIEACDIEGSSDSSIRNATINDVKGLLEKTSIKKILTNGKKADQLYRTYIKEPDAVCMPSTSPANAACTLEMLIQKWRESLL